MNAHASRPAGLVAFGILQSILGIFAVVLVLGVSASHEIAQRGAVPPSGGALASAVVVYGLTAIHLISAGIGSIRGRRWARALSVVVSAIWAVAGAVTLLTMAIAGRHGGEGLSRQLLMTAAAGVALPLLLFFYYRRDDVRAACEELDPTVRWTDRTPLPVLGVVIVLAFSAAALLSNLAVPSFQVLGRQVTGAPAALTMFALAVLCAVLALESYKLNESAWWTLILLQVIGLAWAVTSFVMAGGGGDPLFTALVAATWIAYFGFLLSIRRYFVRPLVPRTRREDQSSVAA